MTRSGDALLNHYRQRGTFADRLGEFNQAIGVHLSSQGARAVAAFSGEPTKVTDRYGATLPSVRCYTTEWS